MKKSKKLLTFVLSAIFALTALCVFAACDNDAGTAKYEVVVSNSELVVIKANEAEGDVSLYAVMTALQEDGKLTFTDTDGFVTSVNGAENAADFSACWMIYTDMTELDGVTYATTEYGSYTYENKVYASASYGVSDLPVVDGYTYILHYDTF